MRTTEKGANDSRPKPFAPEELHLISRRGLEKCSLVLETVALQREQEILRENFAAIVSHELKSPLGAIQQNLFVLAHELSEAVSDNQKRKLKRKKPGINNLLKLIHAWLRGISVDIESIKENFEPVSIPSSVTKAVENIEPPRTSEDIEIVAVSKSVSLVFGDKGPLTEALVNILSNAVEYSHVGIQAVLTAEDEDDQAVISVADSGVGIALEKLPLIVYDFYRAKS